MRKAYLSIGLLLVVGLLLAGCQGQPQTVEKVVTQVVESVVTTVVEIEKEVTTVVEVEKEITTVVEGETVVITATPEPEQEVTFEAPDPDTYTYVTFGGPAGLDPALGYESAGAEINQNVYETLVFHNQSDPSDFVPQLATEWEVNEDGTQYTFTIREGVTFHNGNELTSEDVAYSIQRGLLQGGTSSPQILLIEPLLGIGLHDISELVDAEGTLADDPAALQAADAAALQAACEQVQAAIVDNGDGTVTFTLAQPFAPFINILAGPWGSILDREWSIENGLWDGDCATWQNFYGVTEENNPINAMMNGTGPYMLESWTPEEELVLVANENYWRSEETGPIWEGAPVGPPAIERIVIQSVDEWGTRFAMLQAGDADTVTVPPENRPQVDPMVGEICDWDETGMVGCEPSENPDGPLRMHRGLTTLTRSDVLFNQAINTEGGNNFIGSGQLDGNGIPADFFSDINVRQAFNYCFDHETFIQEVYQGEAEPNVGYLIPGMIGYDPEGPRYEYDPDAALASLEQAWGGQLATTGFRFQAAYNTGNTTRETVIAILQSCVSALGENYVIEAVGLPWPNFLAQQSAGNLPLFVSGWHEDYHDPHNWAQPFFTGLYAARSGFTEEFQAQVQELVDAGVSETDEAGRAEIYQQLTQLDYDNAVAIRLPVASGRRYEQRWVQGWLFQPLWSGHYFYLMSEGGAE